MIEFSLESTGAGTSATFAVSVVGIGGAGANVIDRIALEGMPGAELICMTSDVRILNNSMAGRKIQLGAQLTQGLGAGGDPELGEEAAQASAAEIRELFQDRSMIFICTGLGGGTGSGAAPVVARLAKESGAFVVVFTTMPFAFEGRRRLKQANAALEELRKYSNALVAFDNDRMGELVLPKKGIQEAFQLADKIIGQSVRAVTSLVTQPGLIRIGMDDLITALSNSDGRCLFGFGQAKGDNRPLDALAAALKSPLLDRGQMLAKSHNVLVHICGGPSVTLHEIETIMRELQKHVNEDAHILFGVATDPKMGDHISVTVLTSLGKEGGVEILPPRTLADTQPRPVASPAIAPLAPPPASAPSQIQVPVAQAAPAPQPKAEPVKESAPRRPAAQAAVPQQRLVPPVPAETAPPVKPKAQKAAPAPNPAPIPAPVQPELLQGFETGELDDEPLEELRPSAPTTKINLPTPTANLAQPTQVEEEEEYEDEIEKEIVDEEDENENIADEEAEEVAEREDEEIVDEEEDDEDEEQEEDPLPPPPLKKFAIRDILMRPKTESATPAATPKLSPNPPAQRPVAQAPQPPAQPKPTTQTPFTPAKPPARPASQQNFDDRLQNPNRGRFEKTEPTVEAGEDLDVPTFLRKRGR